MIIVFGSARIRPEGFDEALSISREHVARSLTEPGCIAHAVHREEDENADENADDAARLVFVERWSDMAALTAHFAVPASRAFGKRLAALASEPPTIELFDATPIAMPAAPSRRGRDA